VGNPSILRNHTIVKTTESVGPAISNREAKKEKGGEKKKPFNHPFHQEKGERWGKGRVVAGP